jgi:tetratricopeptide (TPR) repeat protein
VSIVLEDKAIDTASLADPITPDERSDAEAFKRLGNDATYQHDYYRALSMYSRAIKIDAGNAIYRSNRSAAHCALNQFEEAAEDAYTAVQISPKYAEAWARLGMAYLKLDRNKKAHECYARAVELAGPDVTETMKQGLAEAEAKSKGALEKVSDRDKLTQSRAGKAILDQDWDLALKTLRFHSLVHEQQVSGLVLFAQQMNWPYIDEVRDALASCTVGCWQEKPSPLFCKAGSIASSSPGSF